MNFLIINETAVTSEMTNSAAAALYARLDAVAKGERITIIQIPDPIPPLEAPEIWLDGLDPVPPTPLCPECEDYLYHDAGEDEIPCACTY